MWAGMENQQNSARAAQRLLWRQLPRYPDTILRQSSSHKPGDAGTINPAQAWLPEGPTQQPSWQLHFNSKGVAVSRQGSECQRCHHRALGLFPPGPSGSLHLNESVKL